jgi:hypothetical protein
MSGELEGLVIVTAIGRKVNRCIARGAHLDKEIAVKVMRLLEGGEDLFSVVLGAYDPAKDGFGLLVSKGGPRRR